MFLSVRNPFIYLELSQLLCKDTMMRILQKTHLSSFSPSPSPHFFFTLEPRASDKKEFEDVMKKYYMAIEESRSPSTTDDGPFLKRSGALLFAVCRGKISEGMDFIDDHARAVISIGIPYPNL
jgi:Rad3-related DNA helicase